VRVVGIGRCRGCNWPAGPRNSSAAPSGRWRWTTCFSTNSTAARRPSRRPAPPGARPRPRSPSRRRPFAVELHGPVQLPDLGRGSPAGLHQVGVRSGVVPAHPENSGALSSRHRRSPITHTGLRWLHPGRPASNSPLSAVAATHERHLVVGCGPAQRAQRASRTRAAGASSEQRPNGI